MKKILTAIAILILFIGCSSGDEDKKLNGTLVIKAGIPTDTDVALSWNAIPDAEGYRLYRNGQQIIVSQGTGEIVYTDTGLNLGTNYEYKVLAFKGSKETDLSNSVSIKTQDYIHITKNGTEISPQKSDIRGISISKDGSSIGYYADYDGQAGIFKYSNGDLTNGTFVTTENLGIGQAALIRTNAINETGTRYLLGFLNGTIKVIGDNKLFVGVNATVSSISFIGLNSAIISSEDKSVSIYDTDKGTGVEYTNKKYQDNKIKSLKEVTYADQPYAATVNNSKMVVAYKDNSVTLYYADELGEEIVKAGSTNLKFHKLSSNKKIFISGYDGDNKLYIRNIVEGDSATNWSQIKATITNSSKIKYFDVNSDGTRIAVAGEDKKIVLFDGSGRVLKTISPVDDSKNEYINDIAISGDGKTIVAAVKDSLKIYILK